MMLAHRDRLRGLQEPARAVGQLLKIHRFTTPAFRGRYGVALVQHHIGRGNEG
jgi:hypothetical protein